MRFRPQAIARFGALLPAGAICVPTIPLWNPGLPLDEQLVFATVFAATIYPTFRWIVVGGVTTTDDHVTVHGAWWSRRVPRDSAVKVRKRAGITFLQWRSPSGRSRHTPMIAFTTTPSDPEWFDGYNNRVAESINRWIDRRDLPDSARPRSRARARERRQNDSH